ncbi:calcium/sodium antiporter [Rickettsiales bacterium]|nr:calcium/sodium antiporter [Rickettsiales bacterium]
MTMIIEVIGGLALLFFGGEALIRGAVAMAKDLGISPFVIGLTIVAYGTSSPELVVSVQAALDGHPDIALGNVIGSNLSNILCVMGITAIIYPIAIDKKLSLIDGIFLSGVTAIFVLMCYFDSLNIISALLFISILIIYTFLVFRQAKKTKDNLAEKQIEEVEELLKGEISLPKAITLCIFGIALLIFGGSLLVEGASSLAKWAGLSEAAIAVTIVAFGSSAPELATSVIAAYHKNADIVFGNIIGSNLFNILGVMGATTAVKSIPIYENFLTFDLPLLLIVTFSLSIMIYLLKSLSRGIGVAFLAIYLGYLGLQLT